MRRRLLQCSRTPAKCTRSCASACSTACRRGYGRLLVLGRKRCRPHGAFNGEEGRLRLPRRMQQVANLPGVVTSWSDLNPLLDFRDGRQIEVLPTAQVEQVAGKVADMKALHHRDDGVIFLVVEPRHQRCAIPVNQAFPAARYSCGEIRNSPMIWEIAKKRGAG
jgi:hypothetical protein